MMVQNFRDRIITFGTAVGRLFAKMSRNSPKTFIEPLEKELAVQVEYDMDEQGGSCGIQGEISVHSLPE